MEGNGVARNFPRAARHGNDPPPSPDHMTLAPSIPDYARGRWWLWRLPLLLLLAWDVLGQYRGGAEAPALFAGITFGAHEFGHLFFAFGGETLGILGGSLMQLLLPLGAAALIYHHRDYFGVTVAGLWLASSLFDMATYIADARSFDLDLLSFGEEGGHDWAWLLQHWGVVQHNLGLASAVRGAGLVVLGASVLGGLWLCYQMWAVPRDG